MRNIVSINIPTQVGALNWARAFRRGMKRPDSSIFAAQEVFTGRAKRLAKRMTKRRGWGSFGVANSPNPIFYDKRMWEKVDGYIVRLHGPLAKVNQYPGFNAARYATVLVLRNRATGRVQTFINTHLVPEGRRVRAIDRARARVKSIRKIRKIAKEHLALGRDVFLMGDMNWAANFLTGIPGFRWIRRKGIDKIGVAPAKGYRVAKDSYVVFRAPEVDHKHGVEAGAKIVAS